MATLGLRDQGLLDRQIRENQRQMAYMELKECELWRQYERCGRVNYGRECGTMPCYFDCRVNEYLKPLKAFADTYPQYFQNKKLLLLGEVV